MATFHDATHLDLTIMVNNSRTTFISKHYLCAMFAFQPSSLHISKDVLYDSNDWFRIHYTRFLPPPLKVTSWSLVMANIALLVKFESQFLRHHSHARNHRFYCQDCERWPWSSWHSPSMFKCSFIFYFHWTVWFFLRWWLNIWWFFDEIINCKFLMFCLIVTRTL